MAVPRRTARPADHHSPARPAPAQPRDLCHSEPQGRAHRSRRPAASRRPRRPSPGITANRGALGAPDRSRLVRLRGRHRPDQQSPALTNTSRATPTQQLFDTARTTLSTSFNRGVSLEAIAAMPGHRSLDMTLRYARIASRTVPDETSPQRPSRRTPRPAARHAGRRDQARHGPAAP